MDLSQEEQEVTLTKFSSKFANTLFQPKSQKDFQSLNREVEWWVAVDKNEKRQNLYKGFITNLIAPKAQDISINLMWIYSYPQAQETLFPLQYKRGEKVTDTLLLLNEWTKDYPNVTVWFDSEMITSFKEAFESTKQLVSKLDQAPKIHLKNIRELSLIKENAHAFTQDKPVYFRSDLGRVIATYEALKEGLGVSSYLMYTDFKMDPIPYEKLMDPETIYNLNTYGITMAREGHLGFENGFHIVGNHKDNLLKAIKLGLIDINIARASFIKGKELEQIVYDSFPGMFKAFYDLENKGEFTLRGVSFKEGFHQITSSEKLFSWFGYKPFFNEAEKDTDAKRSLDLNNGIVPTKFWNFPRSHFG